jgi:5-methylcytosine-specific restriction endonuclease McrA
MSSFKYFGRSPNRPRDPRRLVIRRKGYGKNWPKQRKRALERDNYTCQKCGYKGRKSSKGRWDVHVHHIRKIAYFADAETGEVDYEAANNLDNLMTLCDHGCHKYYDGHQNKSGFKQLR